METFSMTSATVLAMYMNMVSVNTSSNFAYNAEMQDGKVNAITVCENDGKYLHMQKTEERRLYLRYAGSRCSQRDFQLG